jgi:hypothetical protein
MAIVNISVDTSSRQAVLTVDGQIVPAIACRLNKGIDFDGEPFLHLGYVTEIKNENGLMERREFFLSDDADEGVFASRVLSKDESILDLKAISDITNFMFERRK